MSHLYRHTVQINKACFVYLIQLWISPAETALCHFGSQAFAYSNNPKTKNSSHHTTNEECIKHVNGAPNIAWNAETVIQMRYDISIVPDYCHELLQQGAHVSHYDSVSHKAFIWAGYLLFLYLIRPSDWHHPRLTVFPMHFYFFLR